MSEESAATKVRISTIKLPSTRAGLFSISFPKGSRRLSFRCMKPPHGDPALVVVSPATSTERVTRAILIVREGAPMEADTVPNREAYLGEWRFAGHQFYAFDAGPYVEPSPPEETEAEVAANATTTKT